jgi:hypothetical protein
MPSPSQEERHPFRNNVSFRGKIAEFMDFSFRGWVEMKGRWLKREERRPLAIIPNRISSRKLILQDGNQLIQAE